MMRLRIALDCRIIGKRGIGRYTSSLARALALEPQLAVTLVTNGRPNPGLATLPLLAPTYPLQEQLEMPFRIRDERFDIVHFTGNTAPAIRRTRPRTVVTVHDIMYLKSPREVPVPRSLRPAIGRCYRLLAFLTGTVRADHLIVVSERVREELTERFTSLPPITVIRESFDPIFQAPFAPTVIAATLRSFFLDPSVPYFLHLGAKDPRKNSAMVIQAFAAYRAMGGTFGLVLCGGWRPDLPHALRDRVSVLPFVSDAHLSALLMSAHALVYVPVDEGFGLPLLEAMARGTPVIRSNIPVLNELNGDPRFAVDPRDATALALALMRAEHQPLELANVAKAGLLLASSYSEGLVAGQTLDVYRAVAGL